MRSLLAGSSRGSFREADDSRRAYAHYEKHSEFNENCSQRIVITGQRSQWRPVRAHNAEAKAIVLPCHRTTVSANTCGRVRHASTLATLNAASAARKAVTPGVN